MTLEKTLLEDPIKFLRENPHGFFDGDNESATYDFTWKPTLEELVNDIYETLHSVSTDEYFEHLDAAWRNLLQLAKGKIGKGETEDAFAVLRDLWPDAFGEQAGISWWGSFENLKSSGDPWPELIRSSFRGADDNGPIEPAEELKFAHYVTYEPFAWGEAA
jgi:hypothetical protein